MGIEEWKQQPDELAKQILNDVLRKGDIGDWTALLFVQQYLEQGGGHGSDPEKLSELLTRILEELEQRKPHHAQILRDIHWKRHQTKRVAYKFNDVHGYAQSSGTFYKWLKDARYEYGSILLGLEEEYSDDGSSQEQSDDRATSLRSLVAKNSDTTLFGTIKPLPQEQRQMILHAKSVAALGITLFRFLPAFQFELCEMLARGGHLRVLLSDYRSTAMDMASLRSDSGTPAETQMRRVEEMCELLSRWKANIPEGCMDVRLMDFYPPYGITVVRPLNEDDKAYCQVRLYTFRSSTSLAPTITPDPVTHKQWFDFFHNQFEAMWDIGKCAFTSPAS